MRSMREAARLILSRPMLLFGKNALIKIGAFSIKTVAIEESAEMIEGSNIGNDSVNAFIVLVAIDVNVAIKSGNILFISGSSASIACGSAFMTFF